MKPSGKNDPIAIIGSACRFPGGCSSPSKLWDLLSNPRDVSSVIDRFNVKGYYHKDGSHHGTTNVQRSYFLHEDHLKFDAQFFNISPSEAESIDPQQRVLLETVYEAVEQSGKTIESLRKSDTAVYVGLMNCDYSDALYRDIDSIPTHTATAVARSIASNRLSYFFDWQGPSMTIDTACSSSLVAVHQAVQALRNGETHLAVASGTNLILGPEMYIAESKLNMLSPTGKSRMWDESADGYARGEGVAVVMLKKLSDAITDGDNIECVIRETGVNQDGRSNGLTVPRSSAQEALIRQTYVKSGLDPQNPYDRCQYFEAHGTGTKAGDPVEAQAIYNAFFAGQKKGTYTAKNKLYVGSIKTVIGHTESTAGLAGVLKVSLAMKNKTIPPNLHFRCLNPSIEPFYGPLEIRTTGIPWPKPAAGQPLRASVNSFGFGGTNAHVILESYNPVLPTASWGRNPNSTTILCTPLTFSAVSEKALSNQVASYVEYLTSNPGVNARDLAWTLQSHRSNFQFKASFSGKDLSTVRDVMIKNLSSEDFCGIRSSRKMSRVLGVFTGQGAQWETMGRELLRVSDRIKGIAANLEESLSQLPPNDRPRWSLTEQLMAEPNVSRIAEAELSQPLCTAIQIILVDLLQAAGYSFAAVVGHSSGEIAAAYAAGFLSATDAIRIAYYRGLYAKLGRGPDGKQGSMLAVGTSPEDAAEICQMPDFEGRVWVAACNSSSSVTLSGDIDAIAEIQEIFDNEKKFTRILRVDTAYHSGHMDKCTAPYLASLAACNINVRRPRDNEPIWFSSVHEGVAMTQCAATKDSYWIDNMRQTVLFSQALRSALDEGDGFDLAIEVGPHPALKGPALQTISDCCKPAFPYIGVLQRGVDDLEAVSNTLGRTWELFGSGVVDYEAYTSFLFPSTRLPGVIKGLPSYPWDHDRIFWRESRRSRAVRLAKKTCHPLLGTLNADGAEHLHWHNILMPTKQPWMTGHQLQDQVIFPAAGYVTMALEAVQYIAPEKRVALLEVHDLHIGRALAFSDENTGMETAFSLTDIHADPEEPERTIANFQCYSHLNKDSDSLSLNASGCVHVVHGVPYPEVLTRQGKAPPGLVDVPSENFYKALEELGYGYSGAFRGLKSLQRKMNTGRGCISQSIRDVDNFIVHPALLDMALQGVFVGYCHPGDGRLHSLHMPVQIQRITINPIASSKFEEDLFFDSMVTNVEPGSVTGDITIFPDIHENTHACIVVEGVTVVPFITPSAKDDCQMYTETVWLSAKPDGNLIAGADRATSQEQEIGGILERIAFYYLRTLYETITEEETAKGEWNHRSLLNFARHVVTEVDNDRHPFVRPEWRNDSHDFILNLVEQYPDRDDVKLLHAVGEHLPLVIRGETTILEHMTRDNLLDDFYKTGLGFPQANEYIARMAQQICTAYPHLNILEIGAGTGGATKRIFSHIGSNFSTYTYTDISAGFFGKAQEVFKEYQNRMVFKVLDIERDPITQGFSECSFDMIIASNVLHATRSMQVTMENTRKLLKPGGQLLLLETPSNGPIRTGVVMGGLPGWWIGADDGRILAPTMSPSQWNDVLISTGFSGVDTITPQNDPLPFPFFVLTSQAIDMRVSTIRSPLNALSQDIQLQHLVVVGSKKSEIADITRQIVEMLHPFCENVSIFEAVEDVKTMDMVPNRSTVVYLSDLDDPILREMTTLKMASLRILFDQSNLFLWVTKGCRLQEPYMNMSVGLGRSLSLEYSNTTLQYLDLDYSKPINPTIVAQLCLQTKLRQKLVQEGIRFPFLTNIEPEIALEDEKYLVPRIVPNKAQNQRYNANRRTIKEYAQVSLDKVMTICSKNGQGYWIEAALPFHKSRIAAHERKVLVRYSTLRAIRLPLLGCVFICVGIDMVTGEPILALSPSNSSQLQVNSNWVIKLENNLLLNHPQDLVKVAYLILAEALFDSVPRDSTLFVHEPDELLTEILSRVAAESHKHFVYSTSSEDGATQDGLFLHPMSTTSNLKSQVPSKCALFVNLQKSQSKTSLGSRLAGCMPRSCTYMEVSDIFPDEDWVFGEVSPQFKAEIHATILLSGALEKTASLVSQVATVVPCGNLDNYIPDKHFENSTVVDWTTDENIWTRIAPVDKQHIFANNKTFWLIGLTGQLGLSLAEWMLAKGAKNIVLSSRKPNVDSQWLQMAQSSGANIRVMAMDITNRDSVRSAHMDICRCLPPIAGVINGAMVLQDTVFANMDIEVMQKVLRPKVDGTRYLHEIFGKNNLDFFILLSSVACVMGNQGQSNYTAANMFMTSLARQRRHNGLAASVVDISGIVGIGYISRVGQSVRDSIQKTGAMAISEQDFHNMVGEAILAGRPELNFNPEVITGLRVTSQDSDVPWRYNPRFSHLIAEQEAAKIERHSKVKLESVQTLLSQVENETQGYNVLTKSFSSKVTSILQLAGEGVDLQCSLIEMGVDSLVAVDLRAWFSKELSVDVPVLKLLSGATISEILLDVLSRIPENLVPKMVKGNGVSEDLSSKDISESSSPKIIEKKGETRKATTFESSEPPTNIHIGDLALLKLPQSGDISRVGTPSDLNEDKYSAVPSVSVTNLSDTDTSVSVQQDLFDESSNTKESPMSYGQSRLWFLRNYVPNSAAFNVILSARLNGPLQAKKMQQAVQTVGKRHESLRTKFVSHLETGKPIQRILPESQIEFIAKSITTRNEFISEFEKMTRYEFDIENAETMKIFLLSETIDVHYLMIACHHIVMDEASMQILVSDLEKAYLNQPMSPNMLQYPDFASRQRKQFEAGEFDSDIAFWKAQFQSIPPPLSIFPFRLDNIRPAVLKYDFNTVTGKLNSSTVNQIKAICRQNKCTNFHFYVAVLRVLLYRFLNCSDLCIGIADSNRVSQDITRTIGFMINILPVRFRTDATMTFSKCLEEARSQAFGALSHSKVPFDCILNELALPRSTNQTPLFQAFIDYRLGVQESANFASLEMHRDKYVFGKTGYDITIDVIETPGGDTSIEMMVQSDLYTEKHCDILLGSYLKLATEFASNSNLQLQEPSLFYERDIAHAITLGRGPNMNTIWPPTLIHRVKIISQDFPENIALRDGSGNVMSYNDMQLKVNTIAYTLSKNGVEIGQAVGILQDPSCDFICSLLAVMHIGAVYVPLDQRLPVERLSTIINHSAISLVLCQSSTFEVATMITPKSTQIVSISEDDDIPETATVPITAAGSSPAVILFTSGTTGIPKGIILRHYNLINEIEGFTRQYSIGPETVMQQSAPSFDFSLEQIFLALANAGTLCILPKEKRGDPWEISKFISEKGITVTQGTPSEYQSWMRYGSTSHLLESQWRMAVNGGEQFTQDLARSFLKLGKKDLKVLNIYGPTEVTISSHKTEVLYNNVVNSTAARVPVGRSLPNYQTFITDNNMTILPVGYLGEVVIGGLGVAQGYLDAYDKTSDSFVYFASRPELGRVYRTGDKGFLLEDGSLTILGRLEDNNQIKLRGIRMELEDIESAVILAARGDIVDVTVSVHGEENTSLVAHVVFAADTPATVKETILAGSLKLALPQYMHPARYVALESIPLTSHGKKDRKAIKLLLPLEEIPSCKNSSDALTPLQARLRNLWKSILPNPVRTLSLGTDFFLAGGNSLLMMQLQSLIRQEFSVSLSISELFGHNSLASMASLLDYNQEEISKGGMESTVDWEIETRPPSIQQRPFKTRNSSHPVTIILTGATGFIGRKLLNGLLQDPRLEHVHCIAVRNPTAILDIFSTNKSKMTIHAGDLQLPRLGLCSQVAEEIFSRSACIIHNGADVNFMKSYSSIRAANVGSTRELIQLATPNRIPIHFVSTSGVSRFLSHEDDILEETSLQNNPPPEQATDGYASSKWASEILLERASHDLDIDVTIHRPTSVTGSDISSTDIVGNLLKYSRLMKAVPKSDLWIGFADFISAETVATRIQICVLEVDNTSVDDRPTVRYLHHSGEKVTSLANMQQFLQEEMGEPIDVLSLEQWQLKAEKYGLDSLVSVYLQHINTTRTPIVFRKIAPSAYDF